MPMKPARLLAACLTAVVALAVAATAVAQSPPTRLRGSIAAIDGKTVTIDRFGMSAPGGAVMKELHMTADAVVAAARSLG